MYIGIWGSGGGTWDERDLYVVGPMSMHEAPDSAPKSPFVIFMGFRS